ncbi:hypothetical protein PILCRDRAFT_301803 [Piloderma croceum F 1598]|uniref:Transmembrane protein n=1 Tax=Piloderma croceum (strain F 1598) TaxID=765440 RepID=A0A0C3G5V4_PILCF|nr:hypothetical protein PILCRDRAFT_301803 [Piloderma croceum F 1598]
MSSEIEMNDLPRELEAEQDGTNKQQVEDSNSGGKDYTISAWAWTSTTLFFLLSLCLILSPRLLLFVSETASSTERRTVLTPLESFLALQFGIFLLALSAALVLNIPSAAPIMAPHERHAAPNHPLLAPVGLACALTGFISYNSTGVGPLAFIFFLGSSVIALWSFWVIMFAGSSLV